MVTPLTRTFTLNSLSVLELHHVQAELVTYRDRQAVQLVEQGEPAATDPTIAILADSDFTDGVIEAEIAGAPRPDAPQDMRAFRVQPHGSRSLCSRLRSLALRTRVRRV